MEIRILDPMSRAWERMVALLFRPFDPSVWLVLAFAAWLAGLGYGGGGGSSVSHVVDSGSVGGAHLGSALESVFDHMWALPFIAIGILVGLAFMVLLLWLSSRGKMVWLEAAVTGRAAIVEPWGRLGSLGDSLFLWRLAFGVVILVVGGLFALVIIGPAALAEGSDLLAGLSFAAMAAGVLAVTLLALVAALVNLLLDGFVVPIMYRYRIGTVAAWRALLPWIQRFPGSFALFVGFAVLLILVFGAVYTVLLFVTCCIIAIPIVGTYLGTLLLLPAWTVWRLYTVEFLAQLHPGLDLFGPGEGAEDVSEDPSPV